MYNLCNLWKRGGRGGEEHCKNSHSFFQQNPVCTRIIAFTVLFAVIQKPQKQSHKETKREPKTAYLKITTIIQYIIILLDIFFT